MPLAGLILGSDDSAGLAGTLPALLTVAGQSLIEYQVRVARHCGAGYIVVLVDQMPSALVAAFDRLRADGIDIEIARDAGDAADRIHPDEALLVMASGAVASRNIVASIAAAGKPVLLTVADTAPHDAFERIDAQSRWAGIALLDGKLLRATSAMLGDWTLGPTLLRTAVQAGAAHQIVTEGGQVALLRDQVSAEAFSNSLANDVPRQATGWFARYITNPIARLATPLLLARKVPLDLMIIVPLVLLGSALLLGLTGWLKLALCTFILSGISAAIASIMTSISARESSTLLWFDRLFLPVIAAILVITSLSADPTGSNRSAIVLALWGVSLLLFTSKTRVEHPWHANAESVAIIMLCALLFGCPLIGLALIVLHGLITRISELGWLEGRISKI